MIIQPKSIATNGWLCVNVNATCAIFGTTTTWHRTFWTHTHRPFHGTTKNKQKKTLFDGKKPITLIRMAGDVVSVPCVYFCPSFIESVSFILIWTANVIVCTRSTHTIHRFRNSSPENSTDLAVVPQFSIGRVTLYRRHAWLWCARLGRL